MAEDLHHRPHLTSAEATALAGKLFGLRAAVKPLPSERDQNFLLTSDSGEVYVLKIANAMASPEVIDLQNRAMAWIRARHSSSICPSLRPSAAGNDVESIPGRDGTVHQVRLLSHLPGKPLGLVAEHPDGLLHSLGRFMGMVSCALEGFDHPASHREFKWDLTRAPEVIRERLPLITQTRVRTLIEQVLEDRAGAVEKQRPSWRRSVLHNDSNDYNLLVNPDSSGSQQVTAIIDFGDMIFSQTVHELAITLAYAMLEKPDPIRAIHQVVPHNHAMFPLEESEIRGLLPLACLRSCTSIAVASEQKRQEPGNAYLAITETPAIKLLEKLAAVSAEQVGDSLVKACHNHD